MGKNCCLPPRQSGLMLALMLFAATEVAAEASFDGAAHVHFTIHVREILSVQNNAGQLNLSSNNGDIIIASGNQDSHTLTSLYGVSRGQEFPAAIAPDGHAGFIIATP